jgi:hypothetical protein
VQGYSEDCDSMGCWKWTDRFARWEERLRKLSLEKVESQIRYVIIYIEINLKLLLCTLVLIH